MQMTTTMPTQQTHKITFGNEATTKRNEEEKILSTDDDKWSENEIETKNQQRIVAFISYAFILLINDTASKTSKRIACCHEIETEKLSVM